VFSALCDGMCCMAPESHVRTVRIIQWTLFWYLLHGTDGANISRQPVSTVTTQRYFPEDITLHNHCCENLKCYIRSFHLGSQNLIHWFKTY
jgi:hypothetical protein